MTSRLPKEQEERLHTIKAVPGVEQVVRVAVHVVGQSHTGRSRSAPGSDPRAVSCLHPSPSAGGCRSKVTVLLLKPQKKQETGKVSGCWNLRKAGLGRRSSPLKSFWLQPEGTRLRDVWFDSIVSVTLNRWR